MEKDRRSLFLQQLLLKSLARQEVELLREVYEIFDTEKKGYVTLSDFRRVMSCNEKSPSEEELNEIFRDNDMDGDGKVSFEDMAYVTIKNRDQKDYKEEIMRAFHEFDSDWNVMLDINELQRVLKSLGGMENVTMTEVKEILNVFDINGDGGISGAEFLRKIAF